MAVQNAAVSFGFGTVLVSQGINAAGKKVGLILEHSDTIYPIGKYAEDISERPIDRCKEHVQLLFANVESLDVLIEELQKLRTDMFGESQ